MLLQPAGPGLWLLPVVHRVLGVNLGRQLVVAALPAAAGHDRPNLWIQSPVAVTPELRADLTGLGEVRHVVAPSLWHDEYLAQFQRDFPQAMLHGTAGFAAARRDLRFDAQLTDRPHPDWAGVIDQHLVRGMPRLNEVVFLHRPTRSLILSDLAMCFPDRGPPWSRLMLALAGAGERLAPTRFCRSLMQDRAAVRRSVETILGWDFDRIIVGHGRNIETGGRAAWREAFAFLPA